MNLIHELKIRHFEARHLVLALTCLVTRGHAG